LNTVECICSTFGKQKTKERGAQEAVNLCSEVLREEQAQLVREFRQELGVKKKTQIQLGLAKKMPILWYFHGEDSVIELDFLRD
jgi:hypothetical protein